MAIWDVVAAERAALADDLSRLDEAAWDTESLCRGWTIRDVLAHLTATAHMSKPGFVVRLAAARGQFNTMVERAVGPHLGESPRDALARFRAIRDLTTGPPVPKACFVAEILVHGEDIRRPLGIAHDYPVEGMRTAMEFYTGTDLVLGTRARIEGFHLVATDTDWEHGVGGERIAGPLLSLMIATAGREAGCDDLTGPGAAVLRGRCPERLSGPAQE